MIATNVVPLHVTQDQAVAEAVAWATVEIEREGIVFLPDAWDRARRRCPRADPVAIMQAVNARLKPLGGQFDL